MGPPDIPSTAYEADAALLPENIDPDADTSPVDGYGAGPQPFAPIDGAQAEAECAATPPLPTLDEWAPKTEPAKVVDMKGEPVGEQQKPLTATPFHWTPPGLIPARKWLYGHHLIRGKVSVDVAAGGIGKSILKIVEALAMTTGRSLVGKNNTSDPLRVWLFNLEDEREELQRRIAAACQHYQIEPDEFAGNLFLDSGIDTPCVIAVPNPKTGTVIIQPAVEQMIEQVRKNNIDVVIVDPFVSSHGVPENDNMAIDAVVKRGWVRIAVEGQCAVNLVHHIRKGNGEDATAESARGAKALTDAARSVVVFNRMSAEDAEKAGIAHPRRFFRIFNDKANLAPPLDSSEWYELVSVDLPNGDQVGVPVRWEFPSLDEDCTLADIRKVQEQVYLKKPRADVKSPEWIGNIIGEVMEWDLTHKEVKSQVQNLVKKWTDDGLLYVFHDTDKKRMKRPYIGVKKWVELP